MLKDNDGFERLTGNEFIGGCAGLIVAFYSDMGIIFIANDPGPNIWSQTYETAISKPQAEARQTNLGHSNIGLNEASILGGIMLAGTAVGTAIVSRVRHGRFKQAKQMDELRDLFELDPVEPVRPHGDI
jgi:hypothetical protein